MKSVFLSCLISLGLLLAAAPQAEAQQAAKGWLQGSDYQSYFDRRAYGDLVPITADASLHYGHVRYQAVFVPRPSGLSNWATHHGMSDQQFAQRNQDYLSRGYRLVHHQRFTTEGFLYNQGVWHR